MKISKRSAIKASDDACCEAVVISPYQKAIDSICCAIDALGEIAKNDNVARESIANLSVVLFDLKG